MYCMCIVSTALHCVGVFLLTGLSLLETMLVCFLLNIDDHKDNDSAMASPETDATEGTGQRRQLGMASYGLNS